METVRKTRKLPEQVADKLREMIIQESLKTGAKLPAEAELMERFGVSRSTVREAVKILQTEHIVDIRQGQGTFLCAMPGLASDPLGLRFADQEELIAQLRAAANVDEAPLVRYVFDVFVPAGAWEGGV